MAGVEGNGRCSTFQKYTSYDFTAPPKASHYNFRTRTWSFHAAEGGHQWPGAAYDPVSNKIVLLGLAGLDIYDPVSKTKIRAIDLNSVYAVKDEQGNATQSMLRYNNNLVYFPPNRKLYYFEALSATVFELTLDRSDFRRSSIVRLNSSGRPPPTSEVGYAYDSVNKVIVGGPVSNTFYAYDPSSKSWTTHVVKGGKPGSIAFHAIDYDPVNNVFIFVTDNAGGRRTWAYRHAR
jgi:hypothetical protein